MRSIITTTILSFFFLFANGQSPLDKRIDFSIKNVPLKTALHELSLASGVNIAFSSKYFDEKKTVSIKAKNKSINDILQQLLKRTNTTFMRNGDQIVVLKTKTIKKKYFTISGYLEDKDSGERLIGAHIYAHDHNVGTTSNEYGFYSLTLPSGKATISYSYIGCRIINEEIHLTKDLHKDISIATSLTLSEVVVLGNSQNSSLNNISNDPATELKVLKTIPTLGGTYDPIQQAQLMPGVAYGIDGFGGLYIRGGNVDQNLMLMDGVPIFNPAHMLGLFSIYNSNTIRSAKLYKGGFPARYGGRLSSVFDVRTKEGNQKTWGGEANINLINSSLLLEGPLKKDKSAFFISGRSSHVNYLLEDLNISLIESDSFFVPFTHNFYDLNAKFNYTFSNKDKLYLSFYTGGDIFRITSFIEESSFDNEFFFDQEIKLSWGNDILSLRWNHLFNHKLFSNTTFTYSQFRFGIAALVNFEFSSFGMIEEDSYAFSEFENSINDISIKTDFEYIPNTKHYLRFGGSLTSHYIGLSSIEVEEESEPNEIIDNPEIDSLRSELDEFEYLNSYEFNAYFEEELTISDRLKANLGLRYSLYAVENEDLQHYFKPRLNATFSLNKNISLQTTHSYTSQYLHLISSGIGIPVDIWIPSTNDIKPQTAWQSTVSTNLHSEKNGNFNIEGFYKKMNHIIEKQISIFSIDIDDLVEDDTTFLIGTGTAYGLEFSYNHQFKKAQVFANYTWSKAERQFSKIYGGNSFPFLYDRRHSLQMGFNWQVHPKIEIMGTWVFFTGSPKVYLYGLEGLDAEVKEEINPSNNRNQIRMPNYHRLDASVRFQFDKPKTKHTFLLGARNIYNRQNVAFYEVSDNFSGNENYQVNELSILPFFPSLSYTLKF